MKVRCIISLMASVAALASCKVHTAAPRPTIALVRQIVADTENPYNSLLGAFTPSAKEGALYVLGEPDGVAALSEALVSADVFDNASGAGVPDGLPDFSGESVNGVMDEFGSPYSALLSLDDGTSMRELCVKEALSAMDTACFLSPYDRDGGLYKAPAKIIILSSSYMAAYGQFDLDTLFFQKGCSLSVLSPLQCMLDEIFGEASGSIGVGVLAGRETLSSGIYSSQFAYYRHRYGMASSTCTVLSRRDSCDVIAAFFDDYISAGSVNKLDYLIVDEYGQDVDSLYKRASFLTSVMNPESLKYRNYISDDLKILVPEKSLVSRCYREMRSRGLFSFRIEHPRTEPYMTVASPHDSLSFMLIPFSSRYASDKTNRFYVQD